VAIERNRVTLRAAGRLGDWPVIVAGEPVRLEPGVEVELSPAARH
jgi:hypothetical protein